MRRATAQDVPAVVDILVSAFYDDPTWAWAFPDPTQRAGQHRRLWTLLVDGAMRYPWVCLADNDMATSVWLPPDATDLSEEQEAALEPLVVELVGSGAPRLMETFEMFENAHPRDVPHFFLTLLGTRSEHRGRGIGLGLLADNLREIDLLGMPAYLEASNPANVPLYERYGFDVLSSFRLPDGPEVFTMWRGARPDG
jgi:GNAT superfamily N-acetyltransferase